MCDGPMVMAGRSSPCFPASLPRRRPIRPGDLRYHRARPFHLTRAGIRVPRSRNTRIRPKDTSRVDARRRHRDEQRAAGEDPDAASQAVASGRGGARVAPGLRPAQRPRGPRGPARGSCASPSCGCPSASCSWPSCSSSPVRTACCPKARPQDLGVLFVQPDAATDVALRLLHRRLPGPAGALPRGRAPRVPSTPCSSRAPWCSPRARTDFERDGHGPSRAPGLAGAAVGHRRPGGHPGGRLRGLVPALPALVAGARQGQPRGPGAGAGAQGQGGGPDGQAAARDVDAPR